MPEVRRLPIISHTVGCCVINEVGGVRLKLLSYRAVGVTLCSVSATLRIKWQFELLISLKMNACEAADRRLGDGSSGSGGQRSQLADLRTAPHTLGRCRRHGRTDVQVPSVAARADHAFQMGRYTNRSSGAVRTRIQRTTRMH